MKELKWIFLIVVFVVVVAFAGLLQELFSSSVTGYAVVRGPGPRYHASEVLTKVVGAAASVSCSDSDKGVVLTKQGTTFGYDARVKEYQTWVDSCYSEDKVVEYSCDSRGSNYFIIDVLKCPSRQLCYQGACALRKKLPKPCKLLGSGTVQGTLNGAYGTYAPICKDSSTSVVYSCAEDGYSAAAKEIVCRSPYVCKKGVCG